MKGKLWKVMGLSGALVGMSDIASSLTMEQFSAICKSGKVECAENPYLGAYVGGALDLIATLDGETDYLKPLYCKRPEELFDVPSIIRFMLEHQKEYSGRNAMAPLIRYLEEKGGC